LVVKIADFRIMMSRWWVRFPRQWGQQALPNCR